MEEDNQVGQWQKIKILGQGGFGQVSLWYKRETDEYIAIKKPQRECEKGRNNDRQIERWCRETEIMKKLNHPNIVKALNLPSEFETMSDLPILAMEYCSMGNLRQVLNKPENSCGLSEPTVIKILKDISYGLAYLHHSKVMHRDLKPENIVLQRKDSEVVYKLIDLGYAKELDQSSVCESFVGTVHYLAPELFLGKLYNCSVDYWSFGILAYEIVNGYRPFLPGSNPAEWMAHVQNKDRNIISITENTNGSIICSSTISKVNHMSRCFLRGFEKWLQLALDWDGEARGRDLETHEIVFFHALSELLDKYVVRVFSLPTYSILSYEVKPKTTVNSFKIWLSRDSGIRSDEQVLLFRSGKCLDASGNLMSILRREEIEPGSVSLFLYSCDSVRISSRVVLKPLYVKLLLDDPKKVLSYKHLKRSCSDAVFFIKSELLLLDSLLEAIIVKITNIRNRKHAVENLFEDLLVEWSQVENFSQFLIMSHKADLENYIHLRKEGLLKCSDTVQKWIRHIMVIENQLNDLRIEKNKNEGRIALEEAQQKCKVLDNNEFVGTNDSTVLTGLLNEVYKMWENIHKIPKENRNIMRSNTETVKVLLRCIDYTTKILRSPLLNLTFLQISEAEEYLTKLVPPLTLWSKKAQILRQVIENNQKQRQREVWNMVAMQMQMERQKERERQKEKEMQKEKEREMQQEREREMQKEKERDLEKEKEKDMEKEKGTEMEKEKENEYWSRFELPFVSNSRQISEPNDHLTKLVPPLTLWSKSAQILRQVIENNKKQMQKQAWNMAAMQMQMEKVVEKQKEREREKEKEMELEMEMEMEKEMEVEMEKEKDKEMEKEKDKEMEKGKEKEMEIEMKKETEKEKEKEVETELEKDKEKEMKKEMENEMEKEKDKDMEKEKEKEKEMKKEKEKETEKETEKDKEKEKGKEKKKEKKKDKEREKGKEKQKQKQKEKQTEKQEIKNKKSYALESDNEIEESSETDEDYESYDSYFIPKPVLDCTGCPAYRVYRPNFKIRERVNVPHKSHVQLNQNNIQDHSSEFMESQSIIDTNNVLRTRVEQMNQSWSSLLLAMKSLNWDSIQEPELE